MIKMLNQIMAQRGTQATGLGVMMAGALLIANMTILKVNQRKGPTNLLGNKKTYDDA